MSDAGGVNCDVIAPVLEQKRRIALFNIPPSRYQLVSPYALHTQFQLNMRRKTEILKYNNNQQNTKTNNLTKNQRYAYLANNGVNGNGISAYQKYLQKLDTTECVTDNLIPTSTTACDVPGPPMMLQYDPYVPLYNYGNYLTNRSYSIISETNDVVYNLFTKNEIEYLNQLYFNLYPDVSNIYQERQTPLGVLLIGENINSSLNNFNLNIPIFAWFVGSVNSGYDASDNRIQKPDITDSDVFTIHVLDCSVNIYFNESLVTPLNTPTYDISSLNDCSFHMNTLEKQFYAVQYIGCLNVSNLLLQTPKNTVYDLYLNVRYNYDNNMAYKLDAISTGFFANLPESNSNVQFRCVLDSVPPSPFFQSSFQQYSSSS